MLVKINTQTHDFSIIENNNLNVDVEAQATTIIFKQNIIGTVLADKLDYCYNSKLNINKQTIKLTTESSGYFQLFYYQSDHFIYISDSIFLILPHIENPTLNKQNCLEYLNLSTVLGNQSVFNQIFKFLPHVEYDLKTMQYQKISDFKYDNPYSFDDLKFALENYFEVLSKINQSLYADLSGGYDTRTLASCLLNFKLNFNFLTNNRSTKTSPDTKIAKLIAQELNIPLQLIDIEPKKINPHDFSVVEKTFMVRGVDISHRLLLEIENKSHYAGIKLGGWGAEMLRNKYGKAMSFKEVLNSFAYKRLVFNDQEDEKNYLNQMTTKLEGEILFWSLDKQKSNFNKLLHYRIKARHWVGSMLSMRNHYTPTVFPFYEPSIALIINSLPDNENYQTKLLNTFSSQLHQLPYSSADKPIDFFQKINYLVNKYMRKITKKTGFNFLYKLKMDYPFPLEQIKDDKKFSQFIGVSKSYLIKSNQSDLITRYITLLMLYKNYINTND